MGTQLVYLQLEGGGGCPTRGVPGGESGSGNQVKEVECTCFHTHFCLFLYPYHYHLLFSLPIFFLTQSSWVDLYQTFNLVVGMCKS